MTPDEWEQRRRRLKAALLWTAARAQYNHRMDPEPGAGRPAPERPAEPRWPAWD
jgi:hypothetical protein